jgi:hypothetical protein
MSVPLIFGAIITVFSFLRSEFEKRGILRNRNGESILPPPRGESKLVTFFWLHIFPILSFLVVMFYWFLTSSVLSPLFCQMKSNGSYSMILNPSSECYAGEWSENYGAVWFFIVIYIICLPLSLVYLLWRFRDEVETPLFKQRFANLSQRFKARFYWWEMVAMVKKTGFMLFLQYFSLNGEASLKYFFTIGFLFVFFFLDLVFMPYKSHFNVVISTA